MISPTKAPFIEYIDDISSTGIKCLVVQAEKDTVVKTFATKERTKEFWGLLPPSTNSFIIQNGTHSGFGSYISSWAAEVDGLPPSEQQQIAIQVTLDFLEHQT